MTVLTSPTMARRAQILSLIGSSHGMSHFYGFALAYPMVNSLKAEFGVSYAALGFLLAILNITTAVVQIPVGYAVDRIGPRVFLPTGLFLMATGIGAVAFATDYWMLVALMIVAGAGNAMFHPVNFTILTQTMEQSFMGRAFSIHTFSGNIGMWLVPGTMFVLTEWWGWQNALMFVGTIGLALAALVLVCGHVFQPTEIAADEVAENKAVSVEEGTRVILSRPILLMSAFFAFSTLVITAMQTFMPVALVQIHGVSAAFGTKAVTTYLIASGAGILLGGYLVDKMPYHRSMANVVLVGSAIFLLLVGVWDLSPTMILVLLSGAGLVHGLLRPARDIIARSMTPDHSTGKVFGFLSTGLSIGNAIAPVLFGWIIDMGSPAWVFYGSAIILIISIPTLGSTRVETRMSSATNP